MRDTSLSGKVQTVLKTIEPGDLGIVLPHEHIFIDMTTMFEEPASDEKEFAYQTISLENLSWVRSHRKSNLDNLSPFDEELAIEETLKFKEAGGNTIVEQTPNNMGRAPRKLVKVSQATGLNIIMGTSYYKETVPYFSNNGVEEIRQVSAYPKKQIDTVNDEHIAEEFVQEIEVGVNNTGIRAGFIGEIGCSRPLTNNEKKVLRAAAMAQQQTGALITIHPGFHQDSPLEIVNYLAKINADFTHVVICHIDLTTSTHSTRLELAKTGCYLEWDLFGLGEVYPQPATPVDIPSDQGRIRQIIELIELGYLEQILISRDICNKIGLTRFGGSGYAHILQNTIPIMRRKGMSEEQINTIQVDNPNRAFTLP